MKLVSTACAVAIVLGVVGCSKSPPPTEPAGDEDRTPVATEDQELQPSTDEQQSKPQSQRQPEPQSSDQQPPNQSAMALYREAQALMKAGNFEQGYETAEQAKQQFIAEGNSLAWMMLESIPVNGHRIDVHYNMGPRERNMPESGIVRPLSFRIWSTEGDEELVDIIDFEIGRAGGESITAALGQTDSRGTHSNFGMLPADASYEQIRQAIVELVQSRYGQSD